MSNRADVRIRAELDDGTTPDADGRSEMDVRIPAAGLDRADVLDLEYVDDVIEDEEQYRVYFTAKVGSRVI